MPNEMEKVSIAVLSNRVSPCASLYLSAITQKADPSLASVDILRETQHYLRGFCVESRSIKPAIGGLVVCRDRAAALVAFLRKRGADARLVYGYIQPTALFGNGTLPSEGHSWVHLVLPSGATWVLDPSFGTMEEWLPGKNHPIVEKPFYGLYCFEFGTGNRGQLIETVYRNPRSSVAQKANSRTSLMAHSFRRPQHKPGAGPLTGVMLASRN